MDDDRLKSDRRAAYKAATETFELAKRRDVPALIELLQSPALEEVGPALKLRRDGTAA
jgi:hypothetical protein